MTFLEVKIMEASEMDQRVNVLATKLETLN